ncbi:MAG: pyruvate kinase [Candidatus Marinimicrobia bacterium]|nr:pyruvate kinase [Candidatus Neomarinimicrobiota bacterium]
MHIIFQFIMLNRKTKIIATIGPASSSPVRLKEMIMAGMNVARINMSHYSDSNEVEKVVNLIRWSSKKYGKTISILFDICGPKIRIKSTIPKGKILIKKNKEYSLGVGKVNIPINNKIDFSYVKKDQIIKIDDGKIEFSIISKRYKHSIQVKALNEGVIYASKGINFPNIKLNIPSLNSKDISDINLGCNLKVDWFAHSFVRTDQDYDSFAKIISSNLEDIPVIAKIETPQAIKNIDKLIDIYDGILIARGDLGVELPIEQLPILQKMIIKKCNKRGKPVITATQMLDSMVSSPSPTRAEVADVAGAVYDGADAVMLSAETAVGSYPVDSIKTMSSIAENVEEEISRSSGFQINEPKFKKTNVLTSICHAAYNIALDINIPVIAVMTESGSTAKMVSNFRADANIVAICPYEKIANQLNIFWGVNTLILNQMDNVDDMVLGCQKLLKDKKMIKKKQKFVFIAGVPVGVPGSTNLLKVHEVE